jgi:hypothetical protein
MKRSSFTEEQIISILREQEVGASAPSPFKAYGRTTHAAIV